MNRLTPPPGNIQDRAVFDYLWQMQEYLDQAIQRLEGQENAAVNSTAVKACSTKDWFRSKMVEGDLLAYAQGVDEGMMHLISVNANTTNTPNATAYKYSTGAIYRRAKNQIVVMLFRCNAGEIAINVTENSGAVWTGWKILTEQTVLADHIVEQGLSTVQGSQTCNWYYQKFASGQFVAWMSGVLSSSASNTSKSATFKLPFTLPNTIYGVQLTGTANSNLVSNMGVRNSAGSGSGKTTEQFTVYGTLSEASSVSVGVDIEVRGYWK